MFGKHKTQRTAWTMEMPEKTVDLEALAVAAEPAARAEFPRLRKAFASDHRKDVASYAFECRRFGDFLSVYIQRGGEKHTSAIQLIKAQDIEFKEGHAPDNGSEVRFRYSEVREDENTNHIQYMATQRIDDTAAMVPTPGWSYRISPELPSLPWRHVMIEVLPEKDDKSQHGQQLYGNGNRLRHRIEKAPRGAEDDRIVFVGARTTLYTPHGLGRGVYDAILSALARRAK